MNAQPMSAHAARLVKTAMSATVMSCSGGKRDLAAVVSTGGNPIRPTRLPHFDKRNLVRATHQQGARQPHR